MRTLFIILILALTVNGASPIASFTVVNKTITDNTITVNRNETVCFTSTSTDSDGDSLKYRWIFGDGGDTSGAYNPCHTYRTSGSYTVKLKVSDRRDSIPLLTGKTPANYTLPNGWTLVRAQGFETGSVGANETAISQVATARPYSGNYGMQGRVYKDDCATGWKLNSNIATGSEIYISWYEYIDRQAKMNDEMFLFYVRKEFSSPYRYMGIRWQYLNNLDYWSTSFNIDSANLVLFAEGDATGSNQSRCFYAQGKWIPFMSGQWRQWEVYWKPATGGLQNGTTRIYLNGILKSQVVDTAFNWDVNMSNAEIYIGGTTYTKINWISNATGQCSQDVGHIDGEYSRYKNFKWPADCQNQSPPNGYVPKFDRYIDDIIILQRN